MVKRSWYAIIRGDRVITEVCKCPPNKDFPLTNSGLKTHCRCKEVDIPSGRFSVATINPFLTKKEMESRIAKLRRKR